MVMMVRGPKLLAMALLAGLILTGCEEEEVARTDPIRPVRALKIEDSIVLTGQWVPGRAKATQEVDLSSEVAGKVIDRPVFVGDEVTEGQIVAQLDPRDFENDLEQAKAELDRADAEFRRFAQAAQSGAVARQEVDNAQARLRAANAEVRIRQKALNDATVFAPYDGTVSWVYKEQFEDVRAKEPIVRVVDTSRIEFVVQLPETEISLVPQVENIRVVFDAFPGQEISAEVKEIATEASETTRTFAVNLIMDQPEGFKILPGMTGKVTGDVKDELKEDLATLFVPVTAVFSPDATTSYVWIIDPETKTVEKREVEIGPIANAGVPIKKGLKAGEWVAIAGVHYLEQGQKVEIMEARGDDL